MVSSHEIEVRLFGGLVAEPIDYWWGDVGLHDFTVTGIFSIPARYFSLHNCCARYFTFTPPNGPKYNYSIRKLAARLSIAHSIRSDKPHHGY